MDSSRKLSPLPAPGWLPLGITALAATATSVWYIDAPLWWWLVIGGLGVLLCIGWALTQRRQQRTALCSPWTRLRFHGDTLWIDKNSYHKASIDMVVMGRHRERAWLQILFHNNNTVIAQFSFASLYFPAVEAFLRLRLPLATIKVISVLPSGNSG